MRLDPKFLSALLMSAGLFCLAYFLSAGFAVAQSCGPRSNVVATLEDKYDERPIYVALTDDGRVLEVWANPNGAWTLIMTAPNGQTCVHAVGSQGWEALPQGDAV